MRRAMPFVTYDSRVVLDVLLSSLTVYPTNDPMFPAVLGGSPSSTETRCASEMADIRRGSVQTILQGLPRES